MSTSHSRSASAGLEVGTIEEQGPRRHHVVRIDNFNGRGAIQDVRLGVVQIVIYELSPGPEKVTLLPAVGTGTRLGDDNIADRPEVFSIRLLDHRRA